VIQLIKANKMIINVLILQIAIKTTSSIDIAATQYGENSVNNSYCHSSHSCIEMNQVEHAEISC